MGAIRDVLSQVFQCPMSEFVLICHIHNPMVNTIDSGWVPQDLIFILSHKGINNDCPTLRNHLQPWLHSDTALQPITLHQRATDLLVSPMRRFTFLLVSTKCLCIRFEKLGKSPVPKIFFLPLPFASLWNSVLSPPAHFTWNFITQQEVHSGFIKISDAIPLWSLLSPNTWHGAHLCLARVRRWPSCHWQLCSSTSSLEIGVDTLGSQSSPLLLRWAWSPHSSDRIVAAWGPVLGCSHRGWAESPERNTGDQLPRTWKKNTRKTDVVSLTFSFVFGFQEWGKKINIFSSSVHPAHQRASFPLSSLSRVTSLCLSWSFLEDQQASSSTFNIFLPFPSFSHHCTSSQRCSPRAISSTCKEIKPHFFLWKPSVLALVQAIFIGNLCSWGSPGIRESKAPPELYKVITLTVTLQDFRRAQQIYEYHPINLCTLPGNFWDWS